MYKYLKDIRVAFRIGPAKVHVGHFGLLVKGILMHIECILACFSKEFESILNAFWLDFQRNLNAY